MNEETNRHFLIGCAKALEHLNESEESVRVARRYLSVMERRVILRRGIRQAKKLAQKDNLLKQILFKPPLSLAGEPSSIIVRGEGMLLKGIPVALEFDDKGRHRGTALSDIVDALSAETGRDWGDLEVLELYRRFMSAFPTALAHHPEPRYAKIPRLMDRTRVQRDDLEVELLEHCGESDRNRRRFTVTIDSHSLAQAIERRIGPVTIGYGGGEHGTFLVDGKPVLTRWGHGRGLACVDAADLRSLVGSLGDCVLLVCGLEGWSGETHDHAVVVAVPEQYVPPEPTQFGYFGG